MAKTFMPSKPAFLALLLSGATLALAAPAQARSEPLSIKDSFRIGTSGVVCTAQTAPADMRLTSLFDRGYRLVCRDAAGAIGNMLAVRDDAAAIQPFVSGLQCTAPTTDEVDGVGGVTVAICRDEGRKVDYRRYVAVRGNTSFVVEGLAGYDSALRLGLASLVTDRPVVGEVQVATTSVADAAAFARVQAGTLDPASARAEAYGRNNGASFAEASEFFETLTIRESNDPRRVAEFTANQALQQSNLGNFSAADALLARAERLVPARDAVTQRMIRNFRTINHLNQRQPERALAALAQPVTPVYRGMEDEDVRAGFITLPLSEQINRENDGLKRIGGVDTGLTSFERSQVLDAQAEELRGIALRQQGRFAEAEQVLREALAVIEEVRDGRLVTTAWLRSEIRSELALVAEAQGKMDLAGSAFAEAVEIMEREYPQSPALLAAKARQAAFMGRNGQNDAAMDQFAAVIDQSGSISDASSALRGLLGPYFRLLAQNSDGQSAARFFQASQTLQRPGVAQTQAILARELSEGDDEASALFRLAVTRTREIARATTDVARLRAIASPTIEDSQALALAQETLAGLERDQISLQSRLAAYPRYKVLAPETLTLSDLQRLLKPGEAYYKLLMVGNEAFALFITSDSAQSIALGKTGTELEKSVAALRDSIVRLENGKPVTYPFDLDTARSLYSTLFGPVHDRLGKVTHLIFEPDGPLMQLPPYVLVSDDAGIADYKKRVARPDGDEFDFTGIAWLARDREVSIAVSPRSFADVRAIPASRASRPYLGLGENAQPVSLPVAAVADECSWPLATWRNPINPAELVLANSLLGKGRGEVLVQGAFNDRALTARGDLDDFRVLHFATHGLVTAPRPECPARPALLTSFGDGDSDGLLSFKEVFDLKLDADVVILSACDTAGMATVSASREAGVTTGGNYALDGLVRAFVGAGARSVVASHWPVPDDFDATKRLISGLFGAKPGTPIAGSLRDAQAGLMDDPLTSHPYYWAAFVVLGDGDKPLVR